jgi:hypothetical protein
MSPTQTHCTARVAGVLRQNCCAYIPLSAALALGPRGKFVRTNPIDEILAEFDRALVARGTGLVKTVERIDRNVEAVAKKNEELREANKRLEAMQAEGLFGFAAKIDADTLRIFFTILTKGDIAKASRELDVKDSTLRSIIAGWKKRGKAYAALEEFVRWRKSIKGQAGVEFAKQLASGGERETDFPSLIRDVLEELETFNSDNWIEKVDDLAGLLRSALS